MPVDTDMIAMLFGPFGDMYRHDKRTPYVAEGYVDIHPQDAKELGVEDGDSPAGAAGAVGTMDPATVAEGNAPGMEISPPEPEQAEQPALQNAAETAVGSDLESIREELKRRQEEPR